MQDPIPLPKVIKPVRFDDLPALLAPYATTAPIYVYLLSSGHIQACRFQRSDEELCEEDLILVLNPSKAPLAIIY